MGHQSIRPSRMNSVAAGAALVASLALPAQAQVLAFAQSGDGASIVLHERSGPCTGKARLAEHITAAGQRTSGCWLKSELLAGRHNTADDTP